MAQFKVTFVVSDDVTSADDMMNFLEEQEGVSNVQIEYVQNNLEAKPEVAVGPDNK